jgi:hypothetical protein
MQRLIDDATMRPTELGSRVDKDRLTTLHTNYDSL